MIFVCYTLPNKELHFHAAAEYILQNAMDKHMHSAGSGV